MQSPVRSPTSENSRATGGGSGGPHSKDQVKRLRAKVIQALLGSDLPPPVQSRQLTLSRHLGTRYVPTQRPISSLSCADYFHAVHLSNLCKIFTAYNVLGAGPNSDGPSFLQLSAAAAATANALGAGNAAAASAASNGGGSNSAEGGHTAHSRNSGASVASGLGSAAGGGSRVASRAGGAAAGTGAGATTSGSRGTGGGAAGTAGARVGGSGAGTVSGSRAAPGGGGGAAPAPKRKGDGETPFTRSFAGDMAISREWVVEALLSIIAAQLVPSTVIPSSQQGWNFSAGSGILTGAAGGAASPDPFTQPERSSVIGAGSSGTNGAEAAAAAAGGGGAHGFPGLARLGSESSAGTYGDGGVAGGGAGGISSQTPHMEQLRQARRLRKEQLLQQYREELIEWTNSLCHPINSHDAPQIWEACDLQVKLLERFQAATRYASEEGMPMDCGEMGSFSQPTGSFMPSVERRRSRSIRDAFHRRQSLSSRRQLAVKPITGGGAGAGAGAPTGAAPGSAGGAGAANTVTVHASPTKGNRRHGSPVLGRGECSSPLNGASGHCSPHGGEGSVSARHLNSSMGDASEHVFTSTGQLQAFIHCREAAIVPLVDSNGDATTSTDAVVLDCYEEAENEKRTTWEGILRYPSRVSGLLQLHLTHPIPTTLGKRRKACECHRLMCWSDLMNNLIVDFEKHRLLSQNDLVYTQVPTLMLEEEHKGSPEQGKGVGGNAETRDTAGDDGDDDEDGEDGEGKSGGGGGGRRGRRTVGKNPASGSSLNTTVETDLETFAEELKGLHTQSADHILISTVQPSIITSSKDGVLKVWEPRSGQFMCNLLNIGTAWVLGMWLVHDDQYLLVATTNAELTMVEFPKGVVVQKFRGCTTLVTALRQVTQMDTTLIHRFGLRPGECGPHRTEFKKEMSPDAYKKLFREAQITSDRVVLTAKPINGFVTPSCVFFEPGVSGFFFFGTTDGAVGCFDMTHEIKQSTILSGANSQPIHLCSSTQAHRRGVRVVGMVCSFLNGYLISVADDGSVVKVNFLQRGQVNHAGLPSHTDLSTAALLHDPELVTVTPRSIRLMQHCPTHHLVATAHSDRRVFLWSLGRHTVEFIHQFPQETQDILSITFFSSQRRIAFLTADRTIRVFDFRGFRPLAVVVPSHISENHAEDVASVTLKCSMEDADGCVGFLAETNRIVCALRGPVLYEPVQPSVRNGDQLPASPKRLGAGAVAAGGEEVSSPAPTTTTTVTTASYKAGLQLVAPEDSDEEVSAGNSMVSFPSGLTSQELEALEEQQRLRVSIREQRAAHRLEKYRLRACTSLDKSVVSVMVNRKTGEIHALSPKVWRTWSVYTGRLLREVNLTEQLRNEIPAFGKAMVTTGWWSTDRCTRIIAGARNGICLTLDSQHGTIVQAERVVSETRVKGEQLDRDVSVVFHLKSRTFICAGRTLVARRYTHGELKANGEEDYTSITLRLPTRTTITSCCVIRETHVCIGTIDSTLYFYRLIDQSAPYHQEVLSRHVPPSPLHGTENNGTDPHGTNSNHHSGTGVPTDMGVGFDPEVGAVVGLSFVNDLNQNLLLVILDSGVMYAFSTLRSAMLSRFSVMKPDMCRVRFFHHARSENLLLLGTTLGHVLVLDISLCTSAEVDFRQAIRVTHQFRAAMSEVVGMDAFRIPPRHSSSLRPFGSMTFDTAPLLNNTDVEDLGATSAGTDENSSPEEVAAEGSLFLVVGSIDGNVRVFSIDMCTAPTSASVSPSSTVRQLATGSALPQPVVSMHSTSTFSLRLFSADALAKLGSGSQPASRGSSAVPFHNELLMGPAAPALTVGLLGLDQWNLRQPSSYAANVLPPMRLLPSHQSNEAFLTSILREGKLQQITASGGVVVPLLWGHDGEGGPGGTGGGIDTHRAGQAPSPFGSVDCMSPVQEAMNLTGASEAEELSLASTAALVNTSSPNKRCVSAQPQSVCVVPPCPLSQKSVAVPATDDYAECFLRGRPQRRAEVAKQAAAAAAQSGNGSNNNNNNGWGAVEVKSPSSSCADGDLLTGRDGAGDTTTREESTANGLSTGVPGTAPAVPPHTLVTVLPPTTHSIILHVAPEQAPAVFNASVGPQKVHPRSKHRRNPLMRTYPVQWQRKMNRSEGMTTPRRSPTESGQNLVEESSNVLISPHPMPSGGEADLTFITATTQTTVNTVITDATTTTTTTTTGPPGVPLTSLPSESPVSVSVSITSHSPVEHQRPSLPILTPPHPRSSSFIGVSPSAATGSPGCRVAKQKSSNNSPVVRSSGGVGGRRSVNDGIFLTESGSPVTSPANNGLGSPHASFSSEVIGPDMYSAMAAAAAAALETGGGTSGGARPSSTSSFRYRSSHHQNDLSPVLRSGSTYRPSRASGTGAVGLSIGVNGGEGGMLMDSSELVVTSMSRRGLGGTGGSIEEMQSGVVQRQSFIQSPLLDATHGGASRFTADRRNTPPPTAPRSFVTFPGGGDLLGATAEGSGVVGPPIHEMPIQSAPGSASGIASNGPASSLPASTSVYDQLRNTPAEVLAQRRDQLMLAYMAQRLDRDHPHGYGRHEFTDTVKRVWVRRAGEAQVIAETRAAALAHVPSTVSSDTTTARHSSIARVTHSMNEELHKAEAGGQVEVNLNLLTLPIEARTAQEEHSRLSARERLRGQLSLLKGQRDAAAAERHRREELNPNPHDPRFWLPLISSQQPTHPIHIALPSTLRGDAAAQHQLRQLQRLVLRTNQRFGGSGQHHPRPPASPLGGEEGSHAIPAAASPTSTDT